MVLPTCQFNWGISELFSENMRSGSPPGILITRIRVQMFIMVAATLARFHPSRNAKYSPLLCIPNIVHTLLD